MKVLLAVKSLLPSYGGPAFSVSRLALALANAGVRVGLWASDQSAAITPLLPANVPLQRLGGTAVDVVREFGRPDILHDNGIWLPHNHRFAELTVALDLVRVVSTRGMLEPWALNHKRLKKKIAWWLYQRRDLCRAAYHHATAEAEAKTLRDLRLGVPIGLIPNGIDFARAVARRGGTSQTRTALFLGRVHPIKGLSLLVEAWARLRPDRWQLQIAGPDEIGYAAELEQAISAASLADVVRLIGPLDGEAKERAFVDAELFVLPSFSESFGMAVGEALARGLPVLTTTGAPWSMLDERGCGWSVAPTVEGLTEGLRQATSLDSSKLTTMGERGREFVRLDFAWPSIAGQFIKTYETLLGRRGRHVTGSGFQADSNGG